MSKRRRRSENIPERFFTKRRRRHSLSPSRGPVTELEYTRQLSNLQLELDLLRAQIRLLRREINDIREQQSSGDGDEEVKRTCSLM